MPTNYFVVVVLPNRQIKRVGRLTACNYERCVFMTIFSRRKIRLRTYKRNHLMKLIKKERLKRFDRFKDQNTRRDSLYRYMSVSSYVGAHFKCLVGIFAVSIASYLTVYPNPMHTYWRNGKNISLCNRLHYCYITHWDAMSPAWFIPPGPSTTVSDSGTMWHNTMQCR